MGMFDRSGESAQGRRRYKVALFGEPLGAYLMPVAYHLDNSDALMRPIVARPLRAGYEGDFTYYWPEPDPEGDFITVYWHPELPDEREEAARFYATAHGLRPDGSVDPTAQPPLVGRTVEETRLIRAALADPTADEPYEAYADWLERKGDPYAEFIRLSLRMEPLAEDDEFREKLDDRRYDLAEKHGPKWIRGLTELGLFPASDWQDPDAFDPTRWYGDKGVIEYLAIPGDTFVFRKNPARLFAAAPFLRSLYVYDPEITVADLAAIPQMAQIYWLNLQIGAGTEEAYKVFAASPHFTGLRRLTLYNYGFGPDVVAILAGARWMPTLQGLAIGTNAVGDDGAEAIAESPNCANLDELLLNNNGMTDRGLIAVSRSPHLTKLTTLEVPLNAFSVLGIEALASATFAPTLEHLAISQCGLDEPALAVLAAAPFAALKGLDVSDHKAGDAALRAFVAAPYYRRLEKFHADACDLGSAFARALAAEGSGSLRDLSLTDNRIGDSGVEALASSRAVRNVRALDLSGNRFGTDGVIALADADLTALRELNLSGIRLGREAVMALLKARWRKGLSDLTISEAYVAPRGRELLLERYGDDVITWDYTPASED